MAPVFKLGILEQIFRILNNTRGYATGLELFHYLFSTVCFRPGFDMAIQLIFVFFST